MTTITKTLTSESIPRQLRPFDVRRDLRSVADLVELCFANTLDPDGQRYLQQMRSAAVNPRYLRWATLAAETASLPLSGYVWEDNNRLVGNLTLIPYLTGGRRTYLIANVAVHPDYRRHNIARHLTVRAIEHARSRNAHAIWLHVRDENYAAVELYRTAGFVERARRTTWQARGEIMPGPAQAPSQSPQVEDAVNLRVVPRLPRDWHAQTAWLNRIYPPELNWHIGLSRAALRPGLWGFFYRVFNDIYVKQWSVLEGERLLGVLAWQNSVSYADQIWIAASEQHEEYIVGPLLRHARQRLSRRRPLTLDYPAGHAAEAITTAGFEAYQTLIWMYLDLRD